MYISSTGREGVGVQFVRILVLVLGRGGTQSVKVRPARLATVGGEGKGKADVLRIGGCDVGTRLAHGFGQPPQFFKVVHC